MNFLTKPKSVILLGFAVSVMFWVPHLDSFNVSKQTVLAIAAFTVFSACMLSGSLVLSRLSSPLIWAPFLLFFGFLVSLFIAPNFNLALYGPSGRLNGVLTYVSFLLLYLVISINKLRVDSRDLLLTLSILGAAQTLYNLIQLNGLDPIQWNNPYGFVIGTLGNSDFTIALTSICFIATLWYLLNFASFSIKIALGLLLILEIYVLFESQVRQGLVLIVFGVGCIVTHKLSLISRSLGFLSAICMGGLGAISILGALRIGPLSSLVYKESITFRGDYWRAALEMFKEKPLFGIGFGHFGEAFSQFRDQLQVSRRGPAVISDQAHSVPLDFLATGGIFLTFLYFLLIFVVFHSVLKSFRRNGWKNSQEVFIVLVLYGAYFLQSLISIDQIGLGIWGWIFLGVLANMSRNHEKKSPMLHRRGVSPIVPGIVFSLSSLFMSFQWQADSAIKEAFMVTGDEEKSRLLRLQTLQNLNSPLLSSHYYAEASRILLSNGQIEGVEFAERALEINPRDIEALKYLVILGRQIQDKGLINKYGSRLKELDPYTDLLD